MRSSRGMGRFFSRWPGGACVLAGAGWIGAAFTAACSGDDASTSQPGTAADAGAGDASVVDAGTLDASLGDASASDGASGSSDPDASAIADTGSADVAIDGETTGCALGAAGEPTELRCTGLYSDFGSRTVASDVHAFDPGLHLWSDGAVKTRWIYLPPDPAGDGGTRLPIDTSDMNEWTFPVGTKFWKEFVLGGKRIETRLLWKQATSSWYRTTYRWSPDESSTTELTTGELDADGNGYEVPTQAACRTCHMGRADDVLGFEAVGLASPSASPSLEALGAQGWITKTPDAGIVIPGSAIDVAALGYLHANCGTSCHNGVRGAAAQTGFFMRLEVGSMQTVQATAAWRTGVNQPSFFIPPEGSTRLELLAPGDAGGSCVYFRMSRRTDVDDAGPGIQMPPIDSHKVDEAGVSLIGQWIDALPAELDAGVDAAN